MVHALESVPRLLKPGGRLVDIHPIREAPLIEVLRGSDLLLAESDPGYDYDEGIRHAEDALEDVVRGGLFLVEASDEFELVTYASTAMELRDYWETYGAFDDTPKDGALRAQQEQVYARAAEVMQDAAGAEIRYHERARITRLKPDDDEQVRG